MGLEVIFLGPPGAGKGVHSTKLSLDFGVPHISTGDMLRECIKAGTPLGLEAKSRMDRGEFVPNEVVIGMVLERIAKADAKKGFLLDGFPRTPEQAEAFGAALAKNGRSIRRVIYLRTSNEMAIQRIEGRRVCSGCGKIYHTVNLPTRVQGVCDGCGGPVVQRPDDLPATVRHRLEVYERQTMPLVDYYRKAGLISEVDCDRSFRETHRDLEEIFRGLLADGR